MQAAEATIEAAGRAATEVAKTSSLIALTLQQNMHRLEKVVERMGMNGDEFVGWLETVANEIPEHSESSAGRETLIPLAAAGMLGGGAPVSAGESPTLNAALEYSQLSASSLSESEFAQEVGSSVSHIRSLVGVRHLYAFGERGKQRIPRLQVHEGGILYGLAPIVQALPEDLHPLEFVDLMTGPDPFTRHRWEVGDAPGVAPG
ncbi:hypothetical protein ACF1BN_37610 [Streptomyces sp. NPDC014861]|uniref:hypothetical protein n=1 Tax=Streptomyces sp. NPDC014861 TaxID=3364923 RepID=UPI0036F82341